VDNKVVTTVTTTIKRTVLLSENEAADILREHFNMSPKTEVNFECSQDFLKSIELTETFIDEKQSNG
jgi:hypothetical protein